MIGFIALLNTSDDDPTLPVLPEGWTASPESHSWFTLRNETGYVHARRMVESPATYVIVGTSHLVRELYQWATSEGLPTWTLAALRLDQDPTAEAIRAAWPDERLVDEEGERIGEHVALRATIAGTDCCAALEGTTLMDLENIASEAVKETQE